jgi:glycosyltransferase involved in cell wall biosynthesis
MRVLFIHAADSRLTPEYKVHTTLANHAAEDRIESYFAWQIATPALIREQSRVTYYDFGRDMSITPRPNRQHRAALMMQKLPSALYAILMYARQIRPHIIYSSQQSIDMRIARIISKLLKIPHVIHIHYCVNEWLGQYALNTIRKTSHLIAISEFIRETALLQGILPSSIYTLPNTISPDWSARLTNRRDMRASFGLAADSTVIVAAGRLDPWKNHLLLFDAFATIAARAPQAKLLICGESTTRSNYQQVLKQRVAELGIESSVVFAGYRNDLASIMQQADVFSLPAQLEPFGLVYLEAMMAGLPVVACYSGAVPEIVIPGTTGLLSYPNDSMALAENLLQVIEDKALASRLGQAGKMRAINEFAPQKMSMRWVEKLYQIATPFEDRGMPWPLSQ